MWVWRPVSPAGNRRDWTALVGRAAVATFPILFSPVNIKEIVNRETWTIRVTVMMEKGR
jgi:hypothetical protein